ncbi:hypothetical protein EK904_004187 [Melospiza melodia maxima]|nr:hypothetical protein EK904_004187 [Melospiza melodia maxima]
MEPLEVPPAEPPVLETPQKFFLRVKWQQQQQHQATPPSTQRQQNVPPCRGAEDPSGQAACAEQAGNGPAGELDSDKDDVDVFLVESVEVDADGEMSQRTVASPLQVKSPPWEYGDQAEGRDMRQQLWHSSAIAERVTHNQVQTSSGAVYLLQGKIDSAAMRREGFPHRFIKKFTFGFSRRWKEYVEELLEERRRKEGAQESGGEENEENDSVGGTDVLEPAGGSVSKARKPALRNSTYEVSPENRENIFVTPSQNSRSDSSGVYTRSGRLVKPPLNYWCGQREFVDQGLNVTIQNGWVDHLNLIPSSEKPKRKTRFISKNKRKEDMKTTKEMPKSKSKGKGSGRGAAPRGEPRPACSRRGRRLLSDEEENDPGVRGTKTKPPQLPARGASSKPKELNKHGSRAPGAAQRAAAASAGRSMCEQGYRNSLRSAKERILLTQQPSEDEEEQSSEDTPLLIRRKKKSILKPEPQKQNPCPGSRGSWDDANKACGQRTAKPSQHVLECQGKYLEEQQETANKQQPRKTTVGKAESKDPADKKQPVITAKVGTLKRKQQMREFLEHLPKDNHDDIFSATPLQKRRVQLPALRGSREGDTEDFALSELPLSPSSGLFPPVKTPQCGHISPGMLVPINR